MVETAGGVSEGYLDMQVDAIQQRSADSLAIGFDPPGRTTHWRFTSP